MPRQTIQVLPTDEIRVDEDWGFPIGIVVGDLHIALIGQKVIGGMLAALSDLQRAVDEAQREGEASEAEVLSSAGPELAGLEAA